MSALPAITSMPLEPTDDASAFTLELLRAAVMLTGLADDLIEAIPPDAYPGEDTSAVFVEMVSGTIATAIGEADPDDVRRATELIATACERVVEHLRLALELRRRMEGESDQPPRRAYG